MRVKEFDTVEMLYAVPKQKSLHLRGICKPLYSKMTVMHAVTLQGVGMTSYLLLRLPFRHIGLHLQRLAEHTSVNSELAAGS